MKKKIVTIIIPIYNNENSLNKIYNDLSNQTIGFENMEIIFINDGSTDNTEKKLKKISSENKNIIHISNIQTKGFAYSRNRGIDYCTTDYLIFMNIEDSYEKEFVETQYNTIKKYNADIVKSNFNVNFNGNINSIKFKKDLIISKNINEFPIILLLMIGHGIYNSHFIKKNNLYFDEKIKNSTNSLFHIQCYVTSKKENVFLLNYMGSTWNIQSKPTQKQISMEMYGEEWESYRKIVTLLYKNKISNEFAHKFSNFKIIQQMLRFLSMDISNDEKIKLLEKDMFNATLNLIGEYENTNVTKVNFIY